MSKIKRNCFLLIILSLFFVMACEIGLGKAVDTEPPKLEIQTPQPDAVIRGTYKIGGTWADDGTIESVIVTLKRTDGNGNILSFPANITESKNENPNTWTCIINPTDENAKILDGNYIAQVDITDTGKHTTTKTVQFTIDNTAPIIVLQRPSTKSDALQPDSYGQKFTLEGQAADDNGVSQIELKVYADKDCKTLVHTIPLSNVPNSINLDVAEFKENQESVYSKIYGTMQKDGEKQFYCKIAAYDGAAYYPTDRTQTAEDLKGNSTEIYYLYEDIATTILSTTKITEVYHILSGVYNLNTDTAREISNATADTIKDNLAKNAVHTGSFSLNPANNPTFTVSGKDAFEKDAQGNINFSSGKYDITNGSQVVTEITPGLDNIPLNGDSLKIYFIECDLKGNVLTGAKKIYPKTEVKKSGNTYKFTVPISKSEGVTIGKNYLFGADGTDEKGNSVVSGAAAGYGFHCSTNGEAPGLTITQPQESSVTLCRDKKLDIKGFTTVEIGIPQITIYDNGKLVKTVDFTESQATEDPETKKLIYYFDAQIDFSQTQKSDYHEIEIISECEKVKTARTKTISYDFYPPQISIQSVSPVVEEGGKKCLNGKVKVTFSLTDDFSFIDSTENKPYYELYQDGIAKTGKVFFTSTNSNITETSEIDTAQLDDNKEVEIKVVAYDKAGNKEEYSNKNYFIDQSTDRPKAEPKSKIKLGLYGKENVNNETDNSENYNKIPAGSSVSFTISDDDGIESIKLVEKVSESDTDEKIYEQNGSTMIPFSFNLPETPGFYDYTFTVKDIITPSGENNIYKTEFTIKATAPAPKIEISSKDVDAIEDAEKEDGYIKEGGSFINTISIQSTEKPFTLYGKKESSDTEYVELKCGPKEETDSSAKYEITERPTETTSYSYYVKDCNGIQSNTVTAECKVDNTPPEITYVLPGKGVTKMSSYTFTGTAKDEDSKVQKVEITVSNENNGNPKTVTANGTSSWFYQIDFNSNESNEWKDIFGNNEGKKSITFKATDKAGNSDVKNETFVYDKANPTIKIEQSSVREFMPQSGLTVTATANDSYKLQNIKVIQNYKDNSGKATETTITIPTSEKEKIINQPIPFDSDGKKITPADGIYTYSFKAEDSVGNTAETEKFSVKYDNTPPEITIKNPNNKIGKDAINSESYKFEGTVKEENLYGIYYQILQKGSPTPEQPKFNNTENWKEISASGNSWSFYESFKEGTQVGADKLCEGSYDLYIYAIDKAENVSTECKTTFDVDMNPPQITKNLKAATEAGKITDINASVIYFNSDLKLEVKATDTYKMSDTPVKVIVKTDNNNTEIQKTSEEESEKTIYNIPKTEFTKNQRTTVTITAKDAVGKSTTEKYIVCFDENSPQIKIDSPAQYENISTASKRLKGNVTDNASGVKADSVKYRLTRKYNGQTEEEEVHSGTIDLIGESFEINDFNLFKNDETAETAKEGTFTLYIDASDNLEQPAEQQKVIFFYDKGSPQLKVDDIATPTNKNIAISGKAWDTNEIENVTIYIDDKERWKKTFADRPTSEPSENNYNATFFTGEDKSAAKFEDSENAEKSSYLEDGEHTIKITAKDIAGNEKQIVKTITVDTVAPSFSFDTLPNSDYEETVDSTQRKWYNKNFISLKGTVTDDSKTDVKTSGIKSVQYSVNKDASETEPTWSDLNISQGKWNGTITGLKQGLNIVYLKIEDNAGNYTDNVCTSFYVDSEAPNSCEVLSVDSFESTEENKITTEYEKLTNGTSEITVIIKAQDDEKESEGTFTGLPDNAVTITKIGTTTVNISSEKTENGNFKLTIPKFTECSYTSGIVKAKIKDNAKNESSEFELFTIKLDNIYPKAKINTPLDADSQTEDIEINQTITLSGTVSDNNGIENLVIQYAEVDDTNWMSITEKDQNASIEIQDTQWTLSLDSTKFQDNTSTPKTIKLRAVATDKAGNTGNSGAKNSQSESAYDNENEITVTIDQNTDRPKIGFNNITLGDSMSSAESGHIWLKNTTILYGTTEDDDGIASMQISNDNITWKDVTLNNTKTSWNFDIKNFFNDDAENHANGQHSIYFKVTDNSGKTFTSNENSGLESVYLADGKNKYGSQAKPNSILYLQIDTMPPQVILNGARIGTSGDFKTDYTNMTLGGADRTIQFKLTATDKNGIKGLTGIADFGGIKTLNKPSVKAYTTDDKETSIGAENADYYTVEFTVDLTSDEKVIDGNDGRINLKFTGEDNAGNSSVQTTILNFDYKKPQVSINSPTDSNYVSGNITAYGTIDSVAAMYYALSPSDTIRPAEFGTIESGNLTQPATQSDDNSHSVTTWEGFDPDTLEKKNGTIDIIPKYTQIRGNGVQWFVYFDNGTTTDLATHDIDFKKYLINYEITTEKDISDKNFKTIVKMYLWVKATDEAGNITEKSFPILVDPQGDAPQVTISYPAKDGEILGGAVTLLGTATDTFGTNIGIKNVWVQIDSNYNIENKNCTIEKDDIEKWFADGLNVYTDIKGENPTKVTSADGVTDTNASNYYIQAVVSGSSWSLKINTKGTFSPAEGHKQNVAYRCISQDNDGNLSKVQQQYCLFDADNPVFSDFYLRQYSDNANGTGEITASRLYEDDMWIKGDWWLCGTVSDTQGISSLTINGNSQTVNGNPDEKEDFKYLISANNFDAEAKKIEITATDNATHPATKKCSINLDNTPPDLSDVTIPKNEIKNTNGFFTFSLTVKEDAVGGTAQSGFKYLAFYFERNGNVYDIMRSKTDSDNAITANGLLKKEDGLFWKEISVTRNADSLSMLELSAADKNIHTGGLCKIGGTVYMIIGVNGTDVELNGSPEVTHTTAYFALANVINNNIESGNGTKSEAEDCYGYFENISNDDGDHIVESVQKTGTTWKCEANINSRNIPDGPITLHCTAFDAAGNVATKSFSNLKIANNAPRLASLKVWTDFNGNGNEDENEFDVKYYRKKTVTIDNKTTVKSQDLTTDLIVSGNDKDSDEGGSAFMTVKAETKLIPELVGGNGNLYYTYRIKNDKNSDWQNVTKSKDWNSTGNDDGIDDEADKNGYYVTDNEGTGYIKGTVYDGKVEGKNPIIITTEMLENLNNNSVNNNPTWFEYTIYDSTEGCSPWTDTTDYTNGRLSAKFRVALNVQYNDGVAPNVAIHPFYWNSKADNSVVWDETTKKSLGHIELESDLSDEIKNFSVDGTALGGDPKVSGKIKIEGYAFDNIKLKELYVQFDEHSNINVKTLAAEYASGKWESKSQNNETWNFTAEDVFVNAEGHLVYWMLTVDTATVTGTVGLDKTVKVIAKDERGDMESATDNTNAEAVKIGVWKDVKKDKSALQLFYTDEECSQKVNSLTTDDTVVYFREKPAYQMDIVPYVTGVKTSLSDLSRKTPSMYDRTALGHYPVRVVTKNQSGTEVNEAETITFEGFNLGSSSAAVSASNLTNLTKKDGGYVYDLEVNGIPAINNLNNNNAKGSYTATINNDSSYDDKINYAYNRQPNNVNNNLLTDDIIFDVWEFNSAAAIPISGKIEQPVMKIRPTDGKIGFAFVNGPLYFSMGGSETSQNYSYQYWMGSYDFFTSVGFTYDEAGNSWGVAAGGDINDHQADKFLLMSSKWGIGKKDKEGSYSGVNSKRLESIAMKGTKANTTGTTIYFDKQRIKSPSLASSVHGENTNLYLAYYDAMNDELRFKAGNPDDLNLNKRKNRVYKIKKADNGGAGGFSGVWVNRTSEYTINNGDVVQICNEEGTLLDNKIYKLEGYYDIKENDDVAFRVVDGSGTTQKPFPGFENENNYTQTGSDSEKTAIRTPLENKPMYVKIYSMEESPEPFDDYEITKEPYPYRNATVSIIAGNGTDYGAGEYVSIGVIPGSSADNDVVVAVWYDATRRKLLYSYTTTPLDNTRGTTDRNGWSQPVEVFSSKDCENAGEYCKIAVDKKGGVHIAAYDPINLDLCYAYSSSYNAGNADFKTCVVDSNGVVGSNLTLDVALVNKNPVPYIGYYATSCIKPKYAKLCVPITESDIDGSKNDEVTGKWEISVIPTSCVVEMQSNQHNDINIGIWKNKESGILENSKADTSETENTSNGYNSVSYGNIYGNGTENPVLGYAVKNGSIGDTIETAQMK